MSKDPIICKGDSTAIFATTSEHPGLEHLVFLRISGLRDGYSYELNLDKADALALSDLLFKVATGEGES